MADDPTMTSPAEPTLDASNTAAFDIAIELLGLALRNERAGDHGQAELLRTRLKVAGSPEGLRERMFAGSSLRND